MIFAPVPLTCAFIVTDPIPSVHENLVRCGVDGVVPIRLASGQIAAWLCERHLYVAGT